jgi:hypothetical protein
MDKMKTGQKILIGLGVAGVIYAGWRYIIKPKIAQREAEKQIQNYEQFERERELIAASLPQEPTEEINNNNNNFA